MKVRLANSLILFCIARSNLEEATNSNFNFNTTFHSDLSPNNCSAFVRLALNIFGSLDAAQNHRLISEQQVKMLALLADTLCQLQRLMRTRT